MKTKACYIIVGIILFISFSDSMLLRAQSLKLGIKLDPQVSWLSSQENNFANAGARFGINGGLVIDKYFDNNYAITTGISISTTGGKLSVNEPLVMKFGQQTVELQKGDKLNFKLQYIELPLGLKLKSREFGYTTIFAQLGITTQWRIGATVTSDNVTLPAKDASDQVYVFDAGYQFGGGIQYSLGGTSALVLGILYKNGFIDNLKISGAKAYQNALSLRVGMVF